MATTVAKVSSFALHTQECTKGTITSGVGSSDMPFVLDEGVTGDDAEWTRSLPAIEMRLKAFYGRNSYNNRTFYRVIGGLNETLQEAIGVLNDGTFKSVNLAHKTF